MTNEENKAIVVKQKNDVVLQNRMPVHPDGTIDYAALNVFTKDMLAEHSIIIGVTNYISLTDEQLELFVQAEVDRLIELEAQFTAWDVNTNLRRSLVIFNIVQGRVQNIVHPYMRSLIGAGLQYTSYYDNNVGPIGAEIYHVKTITVAEVHETPAAGRVDELIEKMPERVQGWAKSFMNWARSQPIVRAATNQEEEPEVVEVEHEDNSLAAVKARIAASSQRITNNTFYDFDDEDEDDYYDDDEDDWDDDWEEEAF